MKLILIILISTFLFSDDSWNLTGEFESYHSDLTTSMVNYEKDMKCETFDFISLQLNVDYTNNNFYFQATPYVYNVYSSKPLKNNTFNDPFSESKIFFRSLYVSYKLDDWSIGVGVLPFSNALPMKYSKDSVADGVGLNTLNDNDITSIFGTFNMENSRTIFGVGLIDEKFIPKGEYISKQLQADSKIWFIINTYTPADKWTITNEFLYVDLKYNTEDLSKVYLYGLATTWDDSMDSGFIFYNVVGLSRYESNSDDPKTKEAIYNQGFSVNPYNLDGMTYGSILEQEFPDSFNMSNETLHGASNLLGFRYEIDYFPLETFINIEWFHTFGDWVSGNHGNLYSTKTTQRWDIRDDAYYLNFGILTSRNSLLRFSYEYLEFDEVGRVGASASTIKAEDYFDGNKPAINKMEILRVIFSYKF